MFTFRKPSNWVPTFSKYVAALLFAPQFIRELILNVYPACGVQCLAVDGAHRPAMGLALTKETKSDKRLISKQRR